MFSGHAFLEPARTSTLSQSLAIAHKSTRTHLLTHSHSVSLSHAPMLRACVKECTEYWKLSRGILFFLRYVGMTRMQVRASGKALRLVSRPPQVNRWPGLAEANQELNIKGRLIEERVSSKLGPALREYLPKLRGDGDCIPVLLRAPEYERGSLGHHPHDASSHTGSRVAK